MVGAFPLQEAWAQARVREAGLGRAVSQNRPRIAAKPLTQVLGSLHRFPRPGNAYVLLFSSQFLCNLIFQLLAITLH